MIKIKSNHIKKSITNKKANATKKKNKKSKKLLTKPKKKKKKKIKKFLYNLTLGTLIKSSLG